MAKLILFLALFIAVISATTVKKSYKGYKVIRLVSSEVGLHADGPIGVHEVAPERLQAFYEMSAAVNKVAEAHLLDVWASNAVFGWMDVMIPPHLVNSISELFSNMRYVTHIEDVQDSIDESELNRAQTKNKADFFSDFQTYDVITDWLKEVAANNSGKATTYSIGQTYQGNDIFAIDMAPGAGKPVVVIQCGIHAREWITPSTCCWSIDQILNQDPEGGKLLDTYNIIIIPSLNVDGYMYTHNSDRLWRKNRQPNSGSTCVGTDLNRNYDYQWSKPGASGQPCSETFYGSAPFSGTEAAVVRDFLDKHKANLISYWDIHSYSALWMSPWGYTTTLPTDYPKMSANMKASVDAVYPVNQNTYAYGAIMRIIYQTSGGSIDYSYGDDSLKVVESYSVEAFGNSFTPPTSYIIRIGSEIYAGLRESISLYSQAPKIVNDQ